MMSFSRALYLRMSCFAKPVSTPEQVRGRLFAGHALRASIVLVAIALLTPLSAQAADKWVTSWAASVQGPYPTGNPSAQPVMKFAFPAPEAGARDQTFRLILMPEIWGKQARLRFSNAFPFVADPRGETDWDRSTLITKQNPQQDIKEGL